MTTQDHMSAEDRVAEFLNRWRADGRVHKFYDPSKALVEVIKAAENDALERAAKEAELRRDQWAQEQKTAAAVGAKQIMFAVRRLKHKATP